MALFSEEERKRVWKNGDTVGKMDPDVWRKDANGKLMKFSQYGTRGAHGWQIDWLVPTFLGGDDSLDNLRPLHWTTASSTDRLFGLLR